MRTSGLAAVGLLLLTACGGVSAGSGSDPLAGRTYLSESSSRTLVAGTGIELSFEKGEIRASAGCNHMSGPVEVERDRLVVDEISSTAMGCDRARDDQDSWLAGLLQADPAYTVEGDRLRLTSGGTTVQFVDKKVADPDRPLTGTDWRVVTIVDGDAAGSVPQGAAAVVRFENGRVVARVEGCNVIQGPAEVDADEIRMGQMAHTLKACHGASGELERAVAAVLDGTIGYEIDGPALELDHPSGKGLGLRAA